MVDMPLLREALITTLVCRAEVQVTFHVIMDLYAIHLGPEERRRCDLARLPQLINKNRNAFSTAQNRRKICASVQKIIEGFDKHKFL